MLSCGPSVGALAAGIVYPLVDAYPALARIVRFCTVSKGETISSPLFLWGLKFDAGCCKFASPLAKSGADLRSCGADHGGENLHFAGWLARWASSGPKSPNGGEKLNCKKNVKNFQF